VEVKGGIEPRYDLLELFEKHTTHCYAFERGLYRDMTIERRYDFAVSLIKDLEVAVWWTTLNDLRKEFGYYLSTLRKGRSLTIEELTSELSAIDRRTGKTYILLGNRGIK
jgi:hypothetical protein